MLISSHHKKASHLILAGPIFLKNTSFLLGVAPTLFEFSHRNADYLYSRRKHGNANFVFPSRSYHGSRHSEDKHQSTPAPDWRRYLKTFQQYQSQSDLIQQHGNGLRLLDRPAFYNDFDLWLELILFRRRQHNLSHVKALYDDIIAKDLLLPTIGDTAHGLWKNFLYVGWETSTTWKDVIPYARQLQKRTGCSWQPLYTRMLRHSLKLSPEAGALCHNFLRSDFQPSSADMKDIFRKAVSSDQTLKVFKSMYLDFPIRDLYSTVIPQLCKEGNYKRALQWHNMMVMRKDIPPDATISEPLFRHLKRCRKTDELNLMNKSVAKGDMPFMTSSSQSPASKPVSISEHFNRQLGVVHGIAPKILSDEFCARLFATPAFPINTLVKAIHMLGVDTLGPTSLRELLIREFASRKHSSNSRPISQCLDQLREAGISIDDSTFCTVVRNLAVQGEEELLEEVVNCDMHPDAFEDRRLQETLLAEYYLRGDYQQVRRTLAILAAKCNSQNLQRTLMNLILRSAARRTDLTEIYQYLELMQEKMVPVSAQSVRALRNQMLSPRAFAKPPASVAELPSVIAIYQGILRAGGNVPIIEWREILRRLGMKGLLTDLERLSHWLTEWYSNPSFRASESSSFTKHSGPTFEELPIEHLGHPLRTVFPKNAHQAFVAWGFQRSGELHDNSKTIKDPDFTWRWGLELLRDLKQRGAPIMREALARACRLRFTALIGDGRSERSINKPAREFSVDEIMDMALEIEKLWGSPIFMNYPNKFPPGDSRRLLLLKQQIIHTKLGLGWARLPFSHPSEGKPIERPSPDSCPDRQRETLGDDQKGRVDDPKRRDEDPTFQDDNHTRRVTVRRVQTEVPMEKGNSSTSRPILTWSSSHEDSLECDSQVEQASSSSS